ncbi:TetR/AcrR family transcriptional regulator [Streptomyces sp. NBC_01017]|uniref:ScbR family autoregulator-binding transcription factor n=1 Tax=Streptomyces sp. NBC_01017 TaxID=2903721 RepID=UPI00386C0034|nr:TetR/AcrR family transcriptional regulator [Streptomyces sp. NBC_01017]
MARQARAIQTRKSILLAAAEVFDERGYSTATITEIIARAGVTKGALYFHFTSKEDLALGVIAAQLELGPLPPQRTKLQELTDQGLLFAHQLQHDPLTRASVGLAMDQWSESAESAESGNPFHGRPFQSWADRLTGLLVEARGRGELLPHVDPAETAELLSGSFTGIQWTSQVLCQRKDLTRRVISMFRHLLPTIAMPQILPTLELTPDRAVSLLESRDAALEGEDAPADEEYDTAAEDDAAAEDDLASEAGPAWESDTAPIRVREGSAAPEGEGSAA